MKSSSVKKTAERCRPRKSFTKITHSKFEVNDPSTADKWKAVLDRINDECRKRKEEIPADMTFGDVRDYDKLATVLKLPTVPNQIRTTDSVATLTKINTDSLPDLFYTNGTKRQQIFFNDSDIDHSSIDKPKVSPTFSKDSSPEVLKTVYEEETEVSEEISELIAPEDTNEVTGELSEAQTQKTSGESIVKWELSDKEELLQRTTEMLKKQLQDLIKEHIDKLAPVTKQKLSVSSRISDKFCETDIDDYSNTKKKKSSTSVVKRPSQGVFKAARDRSVGSKQRLSSSLKRLPDVIKVPQTEIADTEYEEINSLAVLVDEDELTLRDEMIDPQLPTRKRKRYYSEKQKAFLKFMYLPERKAARWRKEVNTTIDDINEMSLTEKAAFMEEMVVNEFCNWSDTIGGLSTITPESLKEKFLSVLSLDKPGSSNMYTRLKEHKILPHGLAVTRNAYQKSLSYVLRRYLAMDAIAERTAAKTIGFGTHLPPELRFIPPQKKIESWIMCRTVKKSLENLELAFEKQVLHLRSVDGFCKFLARNPEFNKPDYFLKHGLFSNDTQSSHTNKSKSSN